MTNTPAETHSPIAAEFCGLHFASPIVLLSGCVGFGEEYTRVEGFSNRDVGAVGKAGGLGSVAEQVGTRHDVMRAMASTWDEFDEAMPGSDFSEIWKFVTGED